MRRIQRGVLTGVLLLFVLAVVGCGKTEKTMNSSNAKKVSGIIEEPEEAVMVDCTQPFRVGKVVYHVDDVGNLYAREGEKETLLVEGHCDINTYQMAGGYVFYEYEKEQAGKTEEMICCAKLQDIENTASYTVRLSQKENYDYASIVAIDGKRERFYVQHQKTIFTLDFSCREIRSDTFEGEPECVLPSDGEVYVIADKVLYRAEQDGDYKKQTALSEDLSSLSTQLYFRYGDYLYGERGTAAHVTLIYSYIQISVKTGKVTYILDDYSGSNAQWDKEHHLLYYEGYNRDTYEDETVKVQFAEDGTYQKQTYPVPVQAVRDGKIYYEDKAYLMCYDMDSGEKTVFQTTDKEGYYIGDPSIYNINYIRIIGDTMYYVVSDCRHKLEDRYGAYMEERTLNYAYSFRDKQTSLLTEESICWDELAVELFAEQRDVWMAVLENQQVTDIRFGVTDCNDNLLWEIYAEGLAEDGQVLERVLYEYHVSDAGLELLPQNEMSWRDEAGAPDATKEADYVSEVIKLSRGEAKKLSDKELEKKLSDAMEQWHEKNNS